MISPTEYCVLRELDDRWKWIAREMKDSVLSDELWVYEYKPKRESSFWTEEWGEYKELPHHLFQFIQWDDSEPYNIAELIGEYEREESKVKNIDWAKYQIDLRDTGTTDSEDPQFYVDVGLRMALDFLNQLDEPEQPVELQELIEKYSKDSMSTYDVKVEREKFVNDLQNLLLPEQELPIIPQFVSDWIEETKKQRKSYIYAITQIYDRYETDEPLGEEESRIFQWMEAYDNDEVFARAWLDGYRIKKEPKYIVRFNRGTYKPVFIALDKISNHIHYVESHDYNKEDLRVHLNEWEIRALDDGDVLFEHFAVRAEEQ